MMEYHRVHCKHKAAHDVDILFQKVYLKKTNSKQ